MENSQEKLINLVSGLKRDGADDFTVQQAFFKLLEMKARKNHTPLHGTFELTPLCNLDCKMCYVHLNDTQFPSGNLLPVEIWKELIDEAHAEGMLYASLTGGECLTYLGFDEIYLHLYSIGIVPSVLSNGLLMNEDRINFFLKYPPNRIQITLYGSTDDAYEKVTGKRVFHTVYHNIEALRNANLRISLVLTPSSFMSDDIRQLQEAAKALRLPYSINASLIIPKANTGRNLSDLSVDQYIEIYKVMKELKHETLSPIDPIELPEESHQGDKRFGLQCGGGTSGFIIQYDGKMAPCPSFYELTTEPLKDGFLPAWHHLNQLVSSYPVPAECSSCAYYDYCIHCAVIHNNARKPGHCDPRICERTKKLIQEGFFKMSGKVEGSST